ncbi:hypothetical protein MHM88_05665 [Epibacterium sp. MM17-32]|uniref:hypothetical protein n=1 Tax=Epibacterium sp. MM17-32 TaxID=2917734 RepID=UPI001EF56BD0|nr:hypothetical protein [Epibacterium sp. MM17-32]MCG7627286.1 hypothetical protein [Epibacterium sp. MM17-32]
MDFIDKNLAPLLNEGGGVTFLASNISVYSEIAENAFREMKELEEAGCIPRPDGDGYIKLYDPQRKSFKAALVHIVFAGIWLDARLHLEIVERFSKTKAGKYDKCSYEDKLELLDALDEGLKVRLAHFRDIRRELVHEKAYFHQNTIYVAQQEARGVRELMQDISNRLAG